MAAPSLIFFPPSELLTPVRDFAAEAELERVRAAATIARDRIAEIEGVRVLGPEVKSDTSTVRLAIDLRDTGKDAWKVACEMAGRGFTLDTASNRVIVVKPQRRRRQAGGPSPPRQRPAARALGYAGGVERLREHPAVRGPRRLVALATFVRQAHRDAAPVLGTHRAAHQPVLLEPPHRP